MPFIVDIPADIDNLYHTKIELYNKDMEEEGVGMNIIEKDVIKLDMDLTRDVYALNRFESLVNAWKKNTTFMSSINNIIEDDNFQDILKMDKKKSIPLIINSISKEPSQLVWALNIITNSRIKSKQRLTVTDACKVWVKLYDDNKIKIM